MAPGPLTTALCIRVGAACARVSGMQDPALFPGCGTQGIYKPDAFVALEIGEERGERGLRKPNHLSTLWIAGRHCNGCREPSNQAWRKEVKIHFWEMIEESIETITAREIRLALAWRK